MADPKATVVLEAKRRGEKAFASFQADLTKVAKVAGVAGAAAAGALALITKASFQSIDALAKTSDKLGIATEELVGLRLAAEQTGVAQEKFDLGLQRMTRRIAELAETGRGEAKPALDLLGLSIDDLARRSPDEQFRIVADALSQVDEQSKKVLIGFKLFDAEGVDLIRTAALGREGLDEYAQAAQRLGIAVTRVDAAKIEQANDAINLGRKAIQGLGNAFAIEVAPVITALVTSFTNAKTEAISFRDIARGSIDAVALGVGVLADAWYGLNLIIDGIVLGIKRVELAISQAQDGIRGFLGTTREEIDKQIEQLEFAYETQARVLSEGQAAVLRETIDQQIAALDIDETRTAEIQAQFEAMQATYNELVASGKPSEALAARLQEARLEAEAAAQATANLRTNISPTEGSGGTTAETPEEKAAARAAEALRERQQKELDSLTLQLATKEEAERIALDRRLSILDTSLAAGLVTEERYYQLSGQLAEKHTQTLAQIAEERQVGKTELTLKEIQDEIAQRQIATELRREQERVGLATDLEIFRAALENKLITQQEFYDLSADAAERAQERLTKIDLDGLTEREKFEQKSAKAKTSFVLGNLESLTAGVATHNKALFRLNKFAAIGNAVVNTAEGVTKALSAYPPPINFAMAAAVAAAGLVQIQAIKSASFGGGTTPSVAGSTPTLAGQPVPATSQTPPLRDEARSQSIVNININGPVAGPGGVDDLIDIVQDGLRERIEDRDEVIFTTQSRQASQFGG